MLKRWISVPRLQELGMLGMNCRNVDFINRYNPRHLFPLVDNKLKTNERLKTEKELYIQGDENVKYGTVLRVMSAARSAGVEKLGMITDPLTVK